MQGDVLSGAIATFAAWACSPRCNPAKQNASQTDSLMAACFAACVITRRASRHAFEEQGRSMGATDVIAHLGRTIRDIELQR